MQHNKFGKQNLNNISDIGRLRLYLFVVISNHSQLNKSNPVSVMDRIVNYSGYVIRYTLYVIRCDLVQECHLFHVHESMPCYVVDESCNHWKYFSGIS